jgi:hypothetical protein
MRESYLVNHRIFHGEIFPFLYFSLDRKVPKGQEPHEGPLPHKASAGWHQFRLSLRLSCPASLTHSADPSQLKQGDFTRKADAPDANPGCMRLG